MEAYALTWCLEKTEWYLIEGFDSPEGFDCAKIDNQSSIRYPFLHPLSKY